MIEAEFTFVDLKNEEKLIRFSHPIQDLKKVCMYVHIYFNGNLIENKLFFLEQQEIINNCIDIPIPKKIRSAKIEVKTPNERNKIELLQVEIIYQSVLQE